MADEKKLTINEGMALQKAVNSRMRDLKSLRTEVAVKKETIYPFMTSDNRDKIDTVEPQFDVKVVDKKITELELFLYKIDASIKQANAKTEIDVVADVDTLLAPLT